MNKKPYKKYKAIINNQEFIIEQDNHEIGWYLYVYSNGKIIKDHLQDDIETIKAQAKNEYSVPEEAWVEI